MKKLLIATSLSAALFTSFNATAGSDVTLKVIGNIVPGACVPTLPDGGTIDYGTLRNEAIAPTGVTNKQVQLGKKSMTLTVTCDKEIAVAVTSSDNRSGSNVVLNGSSYIDGGYDNGATDVHATSNGFGLGTTANSVKIGAYSIAFETTAATADSTAVDVITTDDVNATTVTWAASNGAFCSLTSNCSVAARALTVAEKGSLTPKAFKVLTAPMVIAAAVQDNSVLGTDDTITLDGNATISLVYL
ncbi:DUF1120 domain-containing protein [Kluyvera sp. CHPC 1.251]|uniref:DUF1120 domain-containing protein n=1 Tax=Kluyvera sp. CHPC 1.251 TaxID=2995175 RepID=UPI002FD8531A